MCGALRNIWINPVGFNLWRFACMCRRNTSDGGSIDFNDGSAEFELKPCLVF
jgi:hypothetical protein